MPSKRGGVVYHWKHGFIPLDHFAAMQKAHGSQIGAARIMQRHGIADGPKSLHSADRSNGGKGKPSAPKSVTKDHNLAALEVRKTDKGFAVAHKPSGLQLTQHFTKGAAEAARQEHASTPHDLNVSGDELRKNDAAMKHLQGVARTQNEGEAQRKQQAAQVAIAKRNRPVGPKVSNPAKAGDLVVVSREHANYTTGKGRTVTEEHTPGVVTHVHSDGTPIAYKDAQGRFNTVGPRDQTRVMSQDQIDVQGVLGHVKATNKWSGGQDKSHFDNLDAIQSAAKAFRKDKPATPAAGAVHAARAAELRAAAEKKRAESARIAGSVGAPDRAGAMLRAKDSARMNARMDSGLRRSVEATRQAKALESKAHLAEGRAKTAAEKQDAANLAVTASKLSPGDLIQHKGSAHIVTKVNKTTVSVPSIVGGSWEDKVPISGISKHVPLAQLKDANLRAMYGRAANNPKLRAVYAGELKRRGLSVA